MNGTSPKTFSVIQIMLIVQCEVKNEENLFFHMLKGQKLMPQTSPHTWACQHRSMWSQCSGLARYLFQRLTANFLRLVYFLGR